MNDIDIESLKGIANQLRIHSIEATTAAGSGHPTSCCSAADVVAALFFGHMRYDPKNPHYYNNDRFILSKGHAAPLLYAAWAETGLFPVEELLKLRQFGSDLEGHPTPRLPFVDVATGSLGQGLSVGVGMALCARLDNLDYRTYVLMGDGECAEGAVWEAASLAGINQLNNLIAIVDVNRLGQSEPTALGHDLDAYKRRFEAFGWRTEEIDGHDLEEILEVLAAVGLGNQPLVILAKTLKGAGVSFLQDKEGWHGKPLSKEEAARAIAELQPTAKSGIGLPIPAPNQLPAPKNDAPASYPPLDLQARRHGRDARGLRQRAAPHRRGGPARRGDGWRYQELHLLGEVRQEVPGPVHRVLHRRAVHGRRGHGFQHARQGAVRLHVRLLPHARFRPDSRGRHFDGEREAGGLARRRQHRRRRPVADGAGGPRHDAGDRRQHGACMPATRSAPRSWWSRWPRTRAFASCARRGPRRP